MSNYQEGEKTDVLKMYLTASGTQSFNSSLQESSFLQLKSLY